MKKYITLLALCSIHSTALAENRDLPNKLYFQAPVSRAPFVIMATNGPTGLGKDMQIHNSINGTKNEYDKKFEFFSIDTNKIISYVKHVKASLCEAISDGSFEVYFAVNIKGDVAIASAEGGGGIKAIINCSGGK